MRFGVREICNVVFKAKTARKIGTTTFAAGAPVLYFDSLKTSTLEQAATTVYAQGGRGNTRLIAWEGEKTLTFTMEDALISEMGLAILAGAHLYNADSTNNTLLVHTTETVSSGNSTSSLTITGTATTDDGVKFYALELDSNGEVVGSPQEVTISTHTVSGTFKPNTVYLVDYYIEKTSDAYQVDIEPECLGGNFYIEADTLFRDTTGADHAAQFIIPNGKVQSNFTFTMASSGDPSTFTFTVDAFPGYVNNDPTKKVLASIQVLEDVYGTEDDSDAAGDKLDSISI